MHAHIPNYFPIWSIFANQLIIYVNKEKQIVIIYLDFPFQVLY